jgi:starch-binding outer membrane protein, SusD/RagB family
LPGSPSLTALAAADSALHHSFLFDSAALAPPAAGDFTDPLAVYHNYSGTSGDLVNQITFAVGQATTVFVLDTVVAEFGADARAAKLMVGTTAPNAPCTHCNDIATKQVTVSFYQTPSSPVPIIRNEELVLIDAMVQLGLGHFPQAMASVNAVHQHVGGAALAIPNPGTYVGIRDLILHELRLSNIGEPGAERVLALRNYGLEALQTTTWGAADTHATVLPIPISETGPRNGNIAYTCP